MNVPLLEQCDWKDILKIAKGNKCQSKAQLSQSFIRTFHKYHSRTAAALWHPADPIRLHTPRGNQQPKRIPKNNNNKSDLKIYILGPIVELVLQNKYVCQNYFGI